MGILNFNSGDEIIALESTLQNRENVFGNGYAMDFYGDGATEVPNINSVGNIKNLVSMAPGIATTTEHITNSAI